MTIDRALGEYTDKLNAGETIDMDYFQANLSEVDFQEFKEYIPFIQMLRRYFDYESRKQRVLKAVLDKFEAERVDHNHV